MSTEVAAVEVSGSAAGPRAELAGQDLRATGRVGELVFRPTDELADGNRHPPTPSPPTGPGAGTQDRSRGADPP